MSRHARRFLSNFQSNSNHKVCDVEIICSDGIFRTHRLLLASLSNLLKSALHSSLDLDVCVILIPDLSTNDVGNFLSALMTWSELKIDLNKYGSTMKCFGIDINQTLLPSKEIDNDAKSSKQKKNSSSFFQCDVCQKVLKTSLSLKVHSDVHLQRKVFKCEHCDKHFSQKSHLTVHQRIHSGEKPYLCSRCGSRYSVSSNLKKHLLKCDHDNRLKNKMFGDTKDQEDHSNSSNRIKGLPCDVEECSKVLYSKSAIEKHLVFHSGLRPYSCPTCPKSFTQKSHLNFHLRSKHTVSGNMKFSCEVCSKSLSSSSSLQKHALTHKADSEKPFKCNICDKSFIQKAHMQTHMQNHTGQRSFLCVECGRAFVTKSNLKEHTKVHSGEKKRQHQCDICGAAYVNVGDLKLHKLHHSGERPFKCPQCHKAFRGKRLLSDHFRIHTGDKPFHCSNCNKTFASPGGLHLHFKRNDTCRISCCPGTFSLKQSSLISGMATEEEVQETMRNVAEMSFEGLKGSDFFQDHDGND